MKKRRFVIAGAVVAVLIAIVVVLCLKFRPGSSGLLKHLPAESSMVARIDLPGMAGQESLANQLLYSVFAPDSVKKKGVDFRQPAYAFVYQSYLGCVVPLDNESDFLRAVRVNEEDVQTSRGMKWATAFSKYLLCSDGEKALMIGPASLGEQDNLRNMVYQWMKQSGVRVPSAMVQALDGGAGIATMVCSPRKLPQVLSSQFQKVGMDASDLLVVANLTATEEQFSLDMTLQGDTKEWGEVSRLACKPIDGSLAGALDESPLLFAEVGLNGKQLMEVLRRDPDLRTKLLGINMAFDLDLIANSIDGDVSLTVPSLNEDSTPAVLLQASIGDDSFMQHVGEWNGGATEAAGIQFMPFRDDLYLVAHKDFVAYFGTEPHRLFITNQSAYASARPKGVSALPPGAEGCLAYVGVDLQKLSSQLPLSNLLPIQSLGDYNQLSFSVVDATRVRLVLARRD